MNTEKEDNLAEKMKRVNQEQYNILVRMHLSFVLDFTTDESEALVDKTKLKKWTLAPFKKSKGKGIMEGAPLTHEGICQVYQLIEFLKLEQNISTEGVFRRTGSLTRQHELRKLLNQGTTLCLESGPYSVHDCASVLKGFLAELPEPLLSEAHFPVYCQISDFCEHLETATQEERLLQSLQLLLLLLPSENRSLLKDVLDLLHLTASYEGQNKMCADSLATLFTPHLLCPRKLTPEALHANSQSLAKVVSFMIKKADQLYEIPHKLAVDIKAYLKEYEKKKIISPQKCNVNESISGTANTVFSFVDHERTAKENQSNPTETALAQLYAHVRAMPESSKKRKLVKQFNKENGHGTPLQVLRSSVPKNTNKSLGDSIKKHILQKGLLLKSSKKSGRSSQSTGLPKEQLFNSPQSCHSGQMPIARDLFNKKTNDDLSDEDNLAKKVRKSTQSTEDLNDYNNDIENVLTSSSSEPDLSIKNGKQSKSFLLTSTPAIRFEEQTNNAADIPEIAFTPDIAGQERQSMSPITRSTQRMCRAMQETMMTPRSRKPVLLVSGTNINSLASLEKPDILDQLTEEVLEEITDSHEETDKMHEESSLTSDFRDYLNSRSLITASPTDLSFSSRTDDFSSTNINNLTESKMSQSMLHCMNGNEPSSGSINNTSINSNDNEGNLDLEEESFGEEKELVLKPKQFNEKGEPIIYETSF